VSTSSGRLPYVDPARSASSAGLWRLHALMCMMRRPTFLRGVSGAPVTDWKLYDTHYTERYMGTPQSTLTATQRAASCTTRTT